ncbi:MAG TPA: AmmeMemoRadiSam system protein B [Longimicrobium sp.]|jgi:hypothetical protein
MSFVRPPAVAGTFYPAEPAALRRTVAALLAEAPAVGPAPKAVVAPHAGYPYSGPVAASAFARAAAAREVVRRVVLLGPAHHVPFRGVAASGAAAFDTPLGRVRVDAEGVREALGVAGVRLFDAAHAPEHSLETHLPFLQAVLGDFAVVPLVVGDAAPEEVRRVLDALWGGAETFVSVSSDLSHFLDYATARRVDADTCRAVEALEAQAVGPERACGRIPLCGLLLAARGRGMRVETLDLRSSGDTAGPADRVVGYGAWAFFEP